MADVPDGEALEELRRELLAAGAVEVDDFAIEGVGGGVGGSECVRLRHDADGWHVDYRDRGRTREILSAPTFVQARELFVDEALALAGSHGRGPRRRRSGPAVPLSELRREQDGS